MTSSVSALTRITCYQDSPFLPIVADLGLLFIQVEEYKIIFVIGFRGGLESKESLTWNVIDAGPEEDISFVLRYHKAGGLGSHQSMEEAICQVHGLTNLFPVDLEEECGLFFPS